MRHLVPFAVRLAVVMGLVPLAACTVKSDDDEQDFTKKVEEHLDQELSKDLATVPQSDANAFQKYLCRKGDLGARIFSLRSFEGRLCDDKTVPGLKLVGGAALLICWDSNLEDFQDSHCAEKALAAYGMTKATLDKSKVVSQMTTQASEFTKKAAAATGAADTPYYGAAKTVFCLIPKAILGPGASVHDVFCGP